MIVSGGVLSLLSVRHSQVGGFATWLFASVDHGTHGFQGTFQTSTSECRKK